ncbi:hypothetical protein F5Y18DRAFT_427372 [Xylariaceae sp. FL1019]|nr:hypothetical protein F5Y18DRAFT_427372 [Xylariaceae sp. FL1019]
MEAGRHSVPAAALGIGLFMDWWMDRMSGGETLGAIFTAPTGCLSNERRTRNPADVGLPIQDSQAMAGGLMFALPLLAGQEQQSTGRMARQYGDTPIHCRRTSKEESLPESNRLLKPHVIAMSHPVVPRTNQVLPGAHVSIVLKADQPTGREVGGVVRDVLTRGDHHRGIKVRLVDGRIGRVQRMLAGSGSVSTPSSTRAIVPDGPRPRRRGGDGDDAETAVQVNLASYIVPSRRKGKDGNRHQQIEDATGSSNNPISGTDIVSATATCPHAIITIVILNPQYQSAHYKPIASGIDGSTLSMTESPPKSRLEAIYVHDVLIVWAGAAGLAVAARLSEKMSAANFTDDGLTCLNTLADG